MEGEMLMFKKAPSTLLLCLLATTAVAPAWAATAAQEKTDVIALRAETQQLEQHMYEVFNTLNSTDDFDVTCLEKAPTGSTIPVWQCEAAFMKDARSNDVSGRVNQLEGAANTQNGFIPQSGKQLAFKSRKKTQALNDEMMALARQHPELASAMIALNNKRQLLEKAEK
jgi:hypothetical protein